jgi:hypothetical protein
LLPPHDVPAVTGGFDGTPALHTSWVQALPSFRTSVASTTNFTLPRPSHCATLQSPDTWPPITVPSATFCTPQVWFASQVRVWQAVSCPGHSAAVRQPTQWPTPSHWFWPPHDVPDESGGFDGTPAAQTSSVQALPSVGLSLSSATVRWPPLPSH